MRLLVDFTKEEYQTWLEGRFTDYTFDILNNGPYDNQCNPVKEFISEEEHGYYCNIIDLISGDESGIQITFGDGGATYAIADFVEWVCPLLNYYLQHSNGSITRQDALDDLEAHGK